MKQLFAIAIIAFAGATLTSCNKSDTSVSGRMAKVICDCSAKKEINDLKTKMEKATDAGDKMKYAGEIAQKTISAEACKTSALKELKNVPASEIATTLKEYKEKVDKGCPGFYEELQ